MWASYRRATSARDRGPNQVAFGFLSLRVSGCVLVLNGSSRSLRSLTSASVNPGELSRNRNVATDERLIVTNADGHVIRRTIVPALNVALAPKADICSAIENACFVPIADIRPFGGVSWPPTQASRDHAASLVVLDRRNFGF